MIINFILSLNIYEYIYYFNYKNYLIIFIENNVNKNVI